MGFQFKKRGYFCLDPDLQHDEECVKVYPQHYINRIVEQSANRGDFGKATVANTTQAPVTDDDKDDRLLTNYEIAAIILGILCFLALSWFLLFFVAFGDNKRENQINHLKYKADLKHVLPGYFATKYHIDRGQGFENIAEKYHLELDDETTRMAAYDNDELFWKDTKSKIEPFMDRCLFHNGKKWEKS